MNVESVLLFSCDVWGPWHLNKRFVYYPGELRVQWAWDDALGVIREPPGDRIVPFYVPSNLKVNYEAFRILPKAWMYSNSQRILPKYFTEWINPSALRYFV